MKKTIVLALTIVATIYFFSRGQKVIDTKSSKKEFSTEQQCDEIKPFFSEIIVLNTAFLESYEISKKNVCKLIKIIEKEEAIPANFQNDSLNDTKEAKKRSDQIKNVAKRFQNSQNQNIREIALALVKLQDCYNKIIEQHYCLISSPTDYFDSEENVQKLREYTDLCHDQNKYLDELCQSAIASESLKSKKEEGFQLCEAEKSEIEKFLSEVKASGEDSLMSMMNEALAGNPVAMYLVGQCSLSGIGTPINRKNADLYFKMAASLGYAPAIFELSQMHASDNRDPLLSLVYLNLTIYFGHCEYRELYYQQTELLSKVAGKLVVQEIEKIALDKTIKIFEMQEEIKKLKDTYHPALKIMRHGAGFLDFAYTREYWEPFFQSKESLEEFFGQEESGPQSNKLEGTVN